MFGRGESDEGSSDPGGGGGSPQAGWHNPPDEEIAGLLRSVRRIAVVGLSSQPSRPSNGVAAYLLSHGYEIIPVNPHEKETLGEKAYPALIDVPGKIDLVNVFRRSEFAPGVVAEAIKIGARAVWMQEQVVSPEAFEMGRKAGLIMVMNRCMLKAHGRLL